MILVSNDHIRGFMEHIQKADKPILKMSREQGVYSFDMWVPKGPDPNRMDRGAVSTHNRYAALAESGGRLDHRVCPQQSRSYVSKDGAESGGRLDYRVCPQQPRQHMDFVRLGTDLF